MKKIQLFVPVLACLALCLFIFGCGSAAPSSDGGGAAGARIYFITQNAAIQTALLSTYADGGGKETIRDFTSGPLMYTLEVVTLAPDSSVIIAQFRQNGKHYLGLMTPSGGSVSYDIWPDPGGSIPAFNASFAPNSDVTCITGDANPYFLSYATNEASIRALCAASAESYPCLSKSSSYDAFEMLSRIWVKEVGNSNPAVKINNTTSNDSHPSFAPTDEAKIAFISRAGSNYYVAKRDDYSTGSIDKISTDFSYIYPPLIWSEDGAFIYFIAVSGSDSNWYKTEVDNGNQSLVLNHTGAGDYADPKKLPGSSRLFYVLIPTSGTGEIWSMDPATSATLEVYKDGNHNFFDYSNYIN